MDVVEGQNINHLEAKHVYALLTDRYQISRNIRVEWFLENLNKFFSASQKNSLDEFQNEIDIISFITTDQTEDHPQQQKTQHENSKFFISCDTKFTFFSRKYCFVFVLDMSTSVANVDIQHSTILTDELHDVLAKCLRNIVKPFYVPGSKFLFRPEIYLTIVAYLPFYSIDVNNVIIHGYKLSTENINQLLLKVREKIYFYIELLSLNIQSDYFQDIYGHRTQGKSIVPANLSLINMIRFGLLSLNLLPENSHQGIVIVTDGNTSFSDAHTLESALAQLRLSMISCSFIHIGSPPHPDSSLGYVPYIDFMNFIAQATFGAYLSISSDYDCDFETNCFNIFHRAFFVYSFNHGSSSFSKCLRKNCSNIWAIDNPYFYSDQDDETLRCKKKDQQLLRRKQLESQINAGFAQILSYRLREGFTIKRVNLMQNENIIELALTLPWRHNVNIEYHISAYFQRNGNISEEEDYNFTSYEVIVESNYNFLHDASCSKKVFKSPLRATTIKQFCAALKHFNDSDNLGIHFHYFAKNEMYRSIPESIKTGVSLFYLPPSSNVPVVSVPNNEAHLKFAQYWKPICMLDVNMCQKSSLHTHQINVLLKHDYPLPEFLYHPNSIGRYETIQCKQTMTVLNVVLKEWSSFVLLENHSYIKLIKENENKSCSFYLIRIIAQPPCLVLHLAFIGGTSGSLRNQIVNELSQKLKQCKLPQRNLSSSLMQKSSGGAINHQTTATSDNESDNSQNISNNGDSQSDSNEYNQSDNSESQETSENDSDSNLNDTPNATISTPGFISLSSHKRNNSNSSIPVNCFVILNLPIERMLIRYEKIPKDFYSCYKYEEDWRSKTSHQLSSYASLNMFQTLVRFLYHQRFIWCTHDSNSLWMIGGGDSFENRLNITSVSKILSALTLKRIQEGFTLAYNECGVVNLVKEFMMKDETIVDGIKQSNTFPCLVQYIIFPSNVVIRDANDDSTYFEDDEDFDDGYYGTTNADNNKDNNTSDYRRHRNQHHRNNGSSKHLIVTECWIEPQNGRATISNYNNQQQQNYRETQDDFQQQHQQQDLGYDQISLSFYQRDFELVSVLLTYEYLVSYDRSYKQPSNFDHQPNLRSSRNYSSNHCPNHHNLHVEDKISLLSKLSGQGSSSSNHYHHEDLRSSNNEQRFKHIPFKFNLLSILDKSQQALIKFRTLYQLFDFNNRGTGEEDISNQSIKRRQAWNNCTNIMLYSEFVYKICQLHYEIKFNHQETISFIKKTNERLSRHYSGDMESLFGYIEDLEQDLSVVFRCFCKKISDDCIILTLLPSSYKVVRKLIFVDYHAQKINRKLIGELENYQGDNNLCYGSLIIPVIVHKLTFNSLTNILLNYNPIDQLWQNWDLLFDYSIDCSNEQFYPSGQNAVPTMDHNYGHGHGQHQMEEISLEDFAKSIETLFRNSFTDAIYKSLRYGFDSDDRDVKLVLEKICYKTIDYVDITDFLIYTCKHMKPVINSYFEKFPSNSIFDLLSYITEICDFNSSASETQNQNELAQQQQSDILSLKLTPGSPDSPITNCCDHSETLKTNFINLIQSHFSSISTPSNSYYFYDYENIQAKKFTFGEKDAKKKNENLVVFYEKIENQEIDLGKFYEEIKNSSKFLDQDIIGSTKDNAIESLDTNDENMNVAEVNMADFQSLILTRPFFVGFFYSLTLKNGTQVRKISSIPTCLLDIISVSQEKIELENFRVFLNIEIITQNVEPQKVSSNSSVISGGGGADGQMMTDNETVSLNKLLDGFQVYKYIEFFHRIKWMIRDEIVSISHNLFQICPRTLEMVVEHIKHTGKSNTSFIDKVELKFVFSVDEDHNCLTEFRQELGHLKFSNFRLSELGKYFYVIHDTHAERNIPPNTIICTTLNHIDSYQNTMDCLVFNEELFDPPKESLVAEYTIEESVSNFSPNFWLILELEFDEQSRTNYVALYFHSQQNIYLYGSEILNQLKKCLEFLCKKFNQKFLLARLFETRICDDLLISKDDPDPFIKNTVRSTLNSTPISNFWESSINSNFDLDYDSLDNISMKILRTNFISGSFMCDVVWDKHFPLHRRLHSFPSKEGFNTIRSVLNSFIISNRNNLYVYREKSDNVFYMRIYEIECSRDSFSDNFKKNFDLDSTVDVEMTIYHYDNIIVPVIMNTGVATANEDGESKCDSDNDSVNSLNVIRTANAPQQCILMNVHGIVEPSKEIKEDMVAALQRKLDEAVLDILILMLARNPLSKLTSQDVSFIQGRNSQLKNFHFVINECYYPYIVNLKGYIRQNLSTFLHNPKYADRNPEFHFKLFKNGEFHCVKDEDVYLYHCQEESGKDTKGIACVIFSIVSKEKLSEMTPSTFNINQIDINDFVSGYFDYIVTVCNPLSKENLNVKFCINFQIWYAGKIDMKYLNQKLRIAICHSLWEFNLEFKIFKLSTFEDSFSVSSISEPSTPKKVSEKRERRTGLSSVSLKPPLLQMDDNKLFRRGYDKYGQVSSSTIIETVGQENYFDFTNIDSTSQQVNVGSPQIQQQYSLLSNIREIKNKELLCLSHFLKIAIKPWLDYGKQISVPSISRFEFPALMKKSILTITKEFKEYISKFSSDMKMHFLMSSGQQYFEFDYQTEFGLNDDGNSYMILLRHEALWKTKFLHQSENSFVQNFINGKCDLKKFEFAPSFFNPNIKSIHDSNLALNTSNEIKAIEPEAIRCLTPRQKFLLLFIEDQKLTIYLYNWNTNLNTNIVAWFSNMFLWHNARSLLLQSLILQKAGLFHNNPFKRYTLEDLMKMSNIPYKDLLSQSYTISKNISNISSSVFLNTDLLLKYENPNRAYNENKEQLHSRLNFLIFETKNYDYIFSDFDQNNRNKDLYDCFSGQFNSNFNIYIRDLKELSKVWQLHGTKFNYPTMDKLIQHVKSYGRLSHYCLTPLLFSHKWRFVVSLIRNHTLPIQTPRVRHMSGGNILKQPNNEHEFMIAKQRNRRKSGPANMLENTSMLTSRTASDESLDVAVCPHYIQEYVQYLQSLGFSSIKSQKVVSLKKNFDFDQKRYDSYHQNYSKYKISNTSRKTNQYNQNKNEYEKFYLIKTVIGGFYLFEVGFAEPFVYSYLYSIDSKRFVSWTKNSNMNIINFLDELDSIMVRMHLHSFTYDYHLRAIHSYISGRQLFQRGYHLISFLDDFIKYYQKAPNYARNHVYSDNVVFESQQIAADQLYNYIIQHNQDYGINVFTMNSTFSFDQVTGMNEEYVLIHLSSHRIPYMDENSIQQQDNFDIALLVTYQKVNNSRILKPRQLCLKFYLLLTSQRELFPKLYSFRDKGLFRTIRMSSRYALSTTITQENNNVNKEAGDKYLVTDSMITRNPMEDIHNSNDRSTYMGICDEKINYLGYFNAHEIVMLNILDQKVNETKKYLEDIIRAAEIDCLRNHLWENLIMSSNDTQMTMDDFNELLLLVKSIRLDEYDSSLIQFNTFNFNWYRLLAQKLEIKFESTYRKFLKNSSVKMAFFKNNCKDCFILFHLKSAPPYLVEFQIVFNKPPSTQIDQSFLKRCDPQYHELVEDFVNACTSHMWSIMLS